MLVRLLAAASASRVCRPVRSGQREEALSGSASRSRTATISSSRPISEERDVGRLDGGSTGGAVRMWQGQARGGMNR